MNKYKIGDIVNVHTYELRVIGKIVNIDNESDYLCVKLRDSNGQMYEVGEQDITTKLGEDNGNN